MKKNKDIEEKLKFKKVSYIELGPKDLLNIRGGEVDAIPIIYTGICCVSESGKSK
jgi:hypothetical protein